MHTLRNTYTCCNIRSIPKINLKSFADSRFKYHRKVPDRDYNVNVTSLPIQAPIFFAESAKMCESHRCNGKPSLCDISIQFVFIPIPHQGSSIAENRCHIYGLVFRKRFKINSAIPLLIKFEHIHRA